MKNVLWMSLATAILAATYALAVPDARREGSETAHRASAIVGASVRLADKSQAGKVVDFVVSESGCIDYLLVQTPAEEQQYVLVPYGAAKIQVGPTSARTEITVASSAERYQQAPSFQGNDWPDLRSAQSQAKIKAAYGNNALRREDKSQPPPRGRQNP